MISHKTSETFARAKYQSGKDEGVKIEPTVVADNHGPAALRQPVRELDLGPMIEPPGIQKAEESCGSLDIDIVHRFHCMHLTSLWEKSLFLKVLLLLD
jgi:hypothetical protein